MRWSTETILWNWWTQTKTKESLSLALGNNRWVSRVGFLHLTTSVLNWAPTTLQNRYVWTRWWRFKCSSQPQARLRRCCMDLRWKSTAWKKYLKRIERQGKSSKSGSTSGSTIVLLIHLSGFMTIFLDHLRGASLLSLILLLRAVFKICLSQLVLCLSRLCNI